ncbi:hypothetical protein J2S77_000779 [Alkalibacillus salilacus]|uniref:Uncharacterized protein n=1 Tax=Alkalibacillus salilacus TaxID=284582 RepID=A0ABT9VD15_9BACI|nr:hypothetical protein [Alkalibacillus salilacus]
MMRHLALLCALFYSKGVKDSAKDEIHNQA